MKLNLRALLLLTILCACCYSVSRQASANLVLGKVYNLVQPDGTTVPCRIWGDEFYQEVESMDGYLLMRDPVTRVISYARLSADGNELVCTQVRVGQANPTTLGLTPHLRINRRSRVAQAQASHARWKAMESKMVGAAASEPTPTTLGPVKGICLIIDFSDEKGVIPPTEVFDFCNKVGYSNGGNPGSIHDFYSDASNGLLNYTNDVPAAYYTAKNPRSYYDNPNEAGGPKAQELILEALNDMKAKKFKFSDYDSNKDGYIDALNCFYAGTRHDVWAMGLWPHSSFIDFEADGVRTYKYQISDMGSSLEWGTFCHENGHMLCHWDDEYDYNYLSSGVGAFCLMSAGNVPCAFMKLTAGWTKLVSPVGGLVTLPAAGNNIFSFPRADAPTELFLMENMQMDKWRSSRMGQIPQPGAGLAIWHVDLNGDRDSPEMTKENHYVNTLVEADGNWNLERYSGFYGEASDLWKGPTSSYWDATSYPNANWWDGTDSSLGIYSISASGPTMTFQTNVAGDGSSGGTISYPTLQFEVPESRAPEGQVVNVKVLLSTPSKQKVSFGVTATRGTATGNGVDYELLKNLITIPAGGVSATVPVRLLADRQVETDESIGLKLSSPSGAKIDPELGVHTITIVNDGASLSVTTDPAGLYIEGPDGYQATPCIYAELHGSSYWLSAPASDSNGHPFCKWLRNSADFSNNNKTRINVRFPGLGRMDAYKAVYYPARLTDALNNATLDLFWSSSTCWFSQTAVTHDRVSAAQSGKIGNRDSSSFAASLSGPTVISFWWKVSSQAGHDWLNLYLDNVRQSNRITGNADWKKQYIWISSGDHNLSWRYEKDAAGLAGSDCGWVDEVKAELSDVVVLSPNGGESFKAGSMMNVEWAASSKAGKSLRLELWRGGARAAVLGNVYSSTRHALSSFLLPSKLPRDSRYKVRAISNASAKLLDESDQTFTITPR